MVKRAIATLLFCLLSAPAWSQPETFDTRSLKHCGQVTGSHPLSGGRFVTQDGRTVKLALVKAPEYWEKGARYRSWPHAAVAKDRLLALISARQLTLFCEGQEVNRHGETVAHVFDGDQWLQYTLVSEGHVFVFPAPTRRRGLQQLYAAEDQSRAQRLGLWAYNNLTPLPVEDRRVQPGLFKIVYGTVRDAATVGPTTYLNFGDDWRTDFTVEIPAAALRQFTRAGLDPLAFGGQMLEVRGWLDFKAGPRLVVQGPGQVRLMEPHEGPISAPVAEAQATRQ